MKKVILFSGGLDSTWLRTFIDHDICLYFNLGTRYSDAEISRLPNDVKIIDLRFLNATERQQDSFVKNRNLLFTILAGFYGEVIYIGSTKDDIKSDNQPEFFRQLNSLATEIRIETPLIEKGKSEIYSELIEAKPDMKYFSCYSPDTHNNECGTCPACNQSRTIRNGY